MRKNSSIAVKKYKKKECQNVYTYSYIDRNDSKRRTQINHI